MYKVIDANDTGKTRKLLEHCGGKGIFVCAHPERIKEKCAAYGVRTPQAIGYNDFKNMIIENEVFNNKDTVIYIDELEKFVSCCVPYLAGYTLTKD